MTQNPTPDAPVPTINANGVPYMGFAEEALEDVLVVVRPMIANIVSQSGRVMNVDVRSAYSSQRAEYPLVVVSVRFGSMSFGMGTNILSQDDDTNTVSYGALVRDTRIVFDIQTRSDPERYFLVDAVQSGILASFGVNAVDGTLTEAVILAELGAKGVFCKKFEPVEFADPNPTDPRPEAQVYRASLTLLADVWSVWQAPPYIPPNITWVSSAEPGVQTDSLTITG